MPESGVVSLGHENILSLEEIVVVVKTAAQLGIKHVRLTGGEPLVRKGLLSLVEQCAQTPGIESVALTTNATLLSTFAKPLKDAGLSRVNISLDSLDPEQYRHITRCGNLNDALGGIEAALEARLDPVKINVVVIRQLNQDFGSFIELARTRDIHVRFIEYMPVGNLCQYSCPWGPDEVISSTELIQTINAITLEKGWGPLSPSNNKPQGWGPAQVYCAPGLTGTIGFISSVSNHFCATCNRLRLTADGKMRPCLFSDTEIDFRSALRGEASDTLEELFAKALAVKPKKHHHRIGTTRAMHQMGG